MKQSVPIPNYKTFKRFIIITVVTLILLLLGFSAWKSVTEYHLTVSAAEQRSRGYARALREHAERAISEADSLLQDAIDQIKDHGGSDSENNRLISGFLNRHPRNMPQIGAIIFVNREGRLFEHSLKSAVRQANAADREYFMHHRDHPEDKTPFLSRPVKSRISGKWLFTLSRPILSAAGKFEGMVGVAFEIEYFSSFYSSLDLGKKGRILMVRKDGALILAEPFSENDYTSDFTKSALIRTHLPLAPKGAYQIARGSALLENDPRLVAYESLSTYPIVALTNMSIDEVLDSWRTGAILQTALTLAACAGLFLLMIILLRQIKRIQNAYQLQSEQQAEIASAASAWQTTFDSVADAIWILDLERHILRCNSATSAFFGKEPDQVIGHLCCEVVHNGTTPHCSCPFQNMLDSGRRADMQVAIGERWLEVSVDPVRDRDGTITGAVHIVSDITKLKQAEEERDLLEIQLRQAQKMEAIGHLAGGIAHDFNNLLTPIMGYAEMAAASIPNGDPLAPKLTGIITAAHKAKALTQQLLSFGRRQSIASEVIDLNEVILSFNNILRRTIRESIRIDLVLAPEGSFIKGDRSQIEQVILNMTVNAQDAFDGTQGRINIETCKILMDGENARMHPGMVPGEYVLLSFRDNGCGMSAEVINHIFEPFFTTKQVGHGTGLGLATVYGIVKQHDAHISVISHAGEGTTFNIYFPVCTQVPLMVPQVVPAPYRKVAGEVTILVVEDNEMVREMVQEMLTGFGYTVLAASDPHQAIDLLAQNAARIDLLVSDIVMPGMNGPELYEQLVVQIPSLKVVFISGYPINPSLRGGTLEDNVNYLQKPFTAEALLERINLVL